MKHGSLDSNQHSLSIHLSFSLHPSPFYHHRPDPGQGDEPALWQAGGLVGWKVGRLEGWKAVWTGSLEDEVDPSPEIA